MTHLYLSTRKSLCGLSLALLLPLLTGCGSTPDTMDTEEALDIVSNYIARIDSSQYKLYKVQWYDDNDGSNHLYMVSLELIGRNDSCYEYTVHRSYGSPEPQIKPASPRTIPGFTFDKARRIDFDSERPFILPNIGKMKEQIPEGNEFQSVSYYAIISRNDGELYHSATLDLDGKGVSSRRISRRSPPKTEYREMRGIMREGKELEIKIDKIK